MFSTRTLSLLGVKLGAQHSALMWLILIGKANATPKFYYDNLSWRTVRLISNYIPALPAQSLKNSASKDGTPDLALATQISFHKFTYCYQDLQQRRQRRTRHVTRSEKHLPRPCEAHHDVHRHPNTDVLRYQRKRLVFYMCYEQVRSLRKTSDLRLHKRLTLQRSCWSYFKDTGSALLNTNHSRWWEKSCIRVQICSCVSCVTCVASESQLSLGTHYNFLLCQRG